MSYYREQLNDWLKQIDVKADVVFDVGGGSKHVRELVKSWDVKNYTVIDNSLEKQVEDTGDYGHIGFDLNYDEVKKDNVLYQAADVVFCLEVFEYIFDPIHAIKQLAKMCKKGALLYITFPFVYPVHNPSDADCLRYTPMGALSTVIEGGFSHNNGVTFRTDRSGKLAEFYQADGMHVAGHSSVTGVMIKAFKV